MSVPSYVSQDTVNGLRVVQGADPAIADTLFQVDLNGTVTTGTWNGSDIEFAYLAQLDGLSVLGRAANDTGDMAAITAASDGQVLQRSGTSLVFGAIGAASFGPQVARRVLIGPDGGADAVPTFRALVAADLPSGIDAAQISTGTVSNTEFDYLNGVTSGIQGQISARPTAAQALTRVFFRG